MAGILGGLFSAFGRMLPGYVQGERDAVKDNWADLKNYNEVQAGQLDNMFTEDTYDARINIMDAARDMKRDQATKSGMDLELFSELYPGMRAAYALQSQYMPMLTSRTLRLQGDQMGLLSDMYNNRGFRNRFINGGGMGGGGVPQGGLPSLGDIMTPEFLSTYLQRNPQLKAQIDALLGGQTQGQTQGVK